LPEGNVTQGHVIRKILILRFSSLGDIVMATPLVRATRQAFPQAQIDMVVREDFLDLIRHNPHLDQKITLARSAGIKGLYDLMRRINRERYDLVYNAHRSLRTLALMPFLKAGHRRYFTKHYTKRSLALTLKLPLLDDTRMLERYIDPLSPFGVSYDGRGPEIFVDDKMRRAAREKVTVERPEGGCLIGIIPSAQWPGKRWPLSRFRELLEHLVKLTSHRMIVLGGPEDDFCEALCSGFRRDRVVNVQGKLSIGESAAVLARCDFVVANDTGMMHVADALGKPSVLMLGPTSAEMGCLPFHPLSRVMEQELWCRPCSKNGEAPCIRGKRVCLTRTTTEAVFHAAVSLARELGFGNVPA
jgi:heptosyltransferase-2